MSTSPTTTPTISPTSPTSPTSSITENKSENKSENESENESENTKISVFKISNQTTTRRFTIPAEKPTWSELELKVRELFSIPTSVSPGLTYSDEEGDSITLSSQTELEDYYKQLKCHDLSDSYKFGLVIFTPIRDFVDRNDGSDVSDSEENKARNPCPTQ